MLRIAFLAALSATALIFQAVMVSGAAAAEAVVRHLWTVEDGLFEPESVALDEERGVIYVSNVVGYGRNGKGYISRLSMSGRMIDEKWIEGLDAPTGMALHGDKLYFADYDHLKVVDVTTRDIIQNYKAPDENPCLNDVAVANNGTVYVSASCRNAVYRLGPSSCERPLCGAGYAADRRLANLVVGQSKRKTAGKRPGDAAGECA